MGRKICKNSSIATHIQRPDLQATKKSSSIVQLDQEHSASSLTTATLPKVQGVRYIENIVCVLYGATCAPFIDRKLQDKRKKNDISRKRAFLDYRILQVGNLEKLAKMELVCTFCRINLN